MPTRKKISPAERRYMNHLRIESLRVGSVYEAKLARERRKELKRVLAIAMNYDDPEKVPDVLADNLSEGYLTDWWQGLWMAAGVPRAQTTARDLQQAKAAGDTDMWKATLRSYASQRAGENIVSVTGTWKDSLVRLVRGLLGEDATQGIEKLTKKIYASYTRLLEKWQCRRIAQTETMIGTAEASNMAAQSLDIHYTKQWCTSGLSNVRDSHAEVDGIVVDEDEPFKLPGGLLLYPHDTSLGADASEIINCACDVIRRPKAGSAAAAKETEPTEEELREQRIQELMKEKDQSLPEEARRALAENDLAVEIALGVKKGKPMNIEEADLQSTNPKYVADKYIVDPNGRYMDRQGVRYSLNTKYGRAKQYRTNCATCSPAFILRLRGFKITAKGNKKGTLNETASKGNSWAMWKNVDGTAAKPTLITEWMKKNKVADMTEAQYRKFFEESTKEKGYYITTVLWKGRKSGHATVLYRDAKGKLFRIEPQAYDKKRGSMFSIDELCTLTSRVPTSKNGVMRVDDKIFDTSWAGLFDTK